MGGEQVCLEAGTALSGVAHACQCIFFFWCLAFVLLFAKVEPQEGCVCGQNCVQPSTELSCFIKPICKHLASGQFQSFFE